LAAKFSLREYSQSRKRVPMEKSTSQPEIVMEEIDRLGGNGKWRQRKAEDYFKRQQIEELERLREQRALEEKRKKRREEMERRRKRQQQEEEEKRLAKLAREREEREEREAEERRIREKERRLREQERAEWAARQPVPCEACAASGTCPSCDGKGRLWATFLAGHVGSDDTMTFGRAPQGCEDCGGCRQNIMGELVCGSGKCAKCNGRGKIWPAAAFEPMKTRSRFRFSSSNLAAGDFSPKSSVGSPKALFGSSG